MGSCYSGLGSKSYQNSSQSPIDRNRQSLSENNTNLKTKSKTKLTNSNQFCSSFEQISYSEVDRIKSNMSSTNRHKIPIPSTRLLARDRVAPKSGSQELAQKKSHNKVQKNKNGLNANLELSGDNSSSTSISSGSSLNISKSSFKSSTSSANSGRPQTAIPIPKSRTPTPPIPVNYVSNNRNRNHSQNHNNKTDKQSHNISSSISDRLNGNRIQTDMTDNKCVTNRSSISNESNLSKHLVPNSRTGIRYVTQVSGLPRPQTAHIVSTASHENCNKSCVQSSDSGNGLTQYSSEKTQQIKCDQSLRQMNKPVSYYYGMSNQCPYKRPNNVYGKPNRFQSQSSNSSSNYLHKSGNNSQHLPESRISVASNISVKPQLQFGVTEFRKLNQNSVNSNEVFKSHSFVNKNQININQIKSCENTNESDLLPKSYQKVREVEPILAQKNILNELNKSATIVKPVETSPEHNSISSTSGTDADNRDFLIDDEICDQPELVLSSSIDKNDLVKASNSELEGLLQRQEFSGPSSPSTVSSVSSTTITSPNTTTFRKPRPLSFVEMPDGSFGLDSPSFRAACQDLIGIKTLLFRLHGILQNAETQNPFDHNYSQNKFYQQLSVSESDETNLNNNNQSNDVQQENSDLKRQIVLQQQIIEDKDRTIRLLQQQMAKYLNLNNCHQNIKPETVNACSQTERCSNPSNIDPRAVSDGSNGMLVSFCCTHACDPNQ